MLLGARQFFSESRKKKPTLLSWVQSDGNAVVDLGFAPTDYRTRIITTASFVSLTSDRCPLVMAGISSGMGYSDSKTGFGFAAIYNDRELFMRAGLSRWWNMTGNAGNWKGGNLHTIEIGLVSEELATAKLDGTSITMTNESSASTSSYPRTPLPIDAQTVFASKANGSYYMKNSVYKVQRVAYELDGVTLADFRAASIDSALGFYDLVSDSFRVSSDGLLVGGDPL